MAVRLEQIVKSNIKRYVLSHQENAINIDEYAMNDDLEVKIVSKIDQITDSYAKFWEIHSQQQPSLKAMISKSTNIEEVDTKLTESWKAYQAINQTSKVIPLYAIYLI